MNNNNSEYENFICCLITISPKRMYDFNIHTIKTINLYTINLSALYYFLKCHLH